MTPVDTGASPRRFTCGPSTPNPTPTTCSSPWTTSRTSLPDAETPDGRSGEGPPKEGMPRAGAADVAMLRDRLEGTGPDPGRHADPPGCVSSPQGSV